MIWISILFLISSCSSPDLYQAELKSVSDFNENQIGNPQIIISRENIPLVKATSEILVKNEKSNAILKGLVKADFFDEDEELNALQNWLSFYLEHQHYNRVMLKTSLWKPSEEKKYLDCQWLRFRPWCWHESVGSTCASNKRS